MENCLLQGTLVRLTAEDPQVIAESFSRWSLDTEYWRLLASDTPVPRSIKSIRQLIEKDLEKDPPDALSFMIKKVDDDQIIGEIDLNGILWTHGEAFLGIGLGERAYWGQGYGTEAISLMLNYAFSELNLQRISLNVFEYNQRALHTYQKVGFREEGCLREYLQRDGKRYDLIFMGILRSEWEEMH